MRTSCQTSFARLGWRACATVALSLVVTASGVAVAKPDNGKGKGKGNSGDFVPPGLADKGGVPPGHRRAPVEVIVTKAPPPVRVEVIPVQPAKGHVWVAGYWMWSERDYVWMPGVWMAPPEPAAVWIAPRFEVRSGVSISISGYWKT